MTGYTIDRKENGESHNATHEEQNHHHSEIPKKEVGVLFISSKTPVHTKPEWSMMNGSGDFKRGIIQENFEPERGSVRSLDDVNLVIRN